MRRAIRGLLVVVAVGAIAVPGAAGSLQSSVTAPSALAAVKAKPKKKPVKPATTVVTVSMYEMGFKLSKTAVPRGTVLFEVKNDGKVEHDFRIGKLGTPMLAAGEAATLRVQVPKAGKSMFLCTVEGHAGAGMLGTLVVK